MSSRRLDGHPRHQDTRARVPIAPDDLKLLLHDPYQSEWEGLLVFMQEQEQA